MRQWVHESEGRQGVHEGCTRVKGDRGCMRGQTGVTELSRGAIKERHRVKEPRLYGQWRYLRLVWLQSPFEPRWE